MNTLVHVISRFTLTGLVLLALVACGGSSAPAPFDAPRTAVDLEVYVADVTGAPIGGAAVLIETAGGVQREATTNPNGVAEFLSLATGNVTTSVSADGFESQTSGAMIGSDRGRQYWSIVLHAPGAWAIGRAIVLGTRVVDLASDGSAMMFSLDLAVIAENSEAIETLTSGDFSIEIVDCGWGGPRECASDSAGNATGTGGRFSVDGGARAFGLQPPSARRPYVVGVLAERSTSITDWYERGPALKSFFTALGGNDTASLASVQTEADSTTLTVLGPFTSDGLTYLDAIDQLAEPAGDPPVVLDSLMESIRRAAAANSGAIPGAESTVLLLADAGLTIPEMDAATALARQLGVRFSTVLQEFRYYGFPELAVRTGGFVAEFADRRQLRMIFGAMDQLLAGSIPYYRMQFRITGDAGTFVSGGNVKVWFRIGVPTSIPSRGVYTSLDVAIP